MKHAVYIGNFSFPLGNAAGKRVYANGKILSENGYEVLFIGLDGNISSETPIQETKNTFDDFIYYNLPDPASLSARMNFIKTYRIITKLLDDIYPKPDLIIYYGSPGLSIIDDMLIQYCRKRKIKIVSDCVDWLTVKTDNPFFDFFKWLDTTYRNIYVNKRADGVIAISDYLTRYYSNAGCHTVTIPPLSPKKNHRNSLNIENQGKIVISYAGIPFRKGTRIRDLNTLKDRIDKTVLLLYSAWEKGCIFTFNIFGFTRDDFETALPSHIEYIDKMGDSVHFFGMLSHEKVTDSIMKSDFTILIRDVNRDTTAGFPTKISESISYGTPVITTKTSDLEKYISEGDNGFFLDIENEISAVDKLSSILKIDRNSIFEMKKRCMESDLFYYRNYSSRLVEFIDSINI